MQVVIIKRAFGSNPYARFELGNCKKLGSKNIMILVIIILVGLAEVDEKIYQCWC